MCVLLLTEAVLVQPELESKVTRFTETFPPSGLCVFGGIGKCSEWWERVGGRIAISVPRDHSSQTRPAVPGGLDASRARFRFTG